jgi:RHS repeat-associated protein
MIYDARGQRFSKTSGGSTTYFNYGQDATLLEESSNHVATDYVYLNGTPIATIAPNASKVYYLHTDRLGTPQRATDAGQNIVWRITYQPFGDTRLSTIGSIAQNLRLPGQYADAETGWNQNGFRPYAAGYGRYIESDLIGLDGGPNLYTYVNSNPLTFTDRSGLAVGDRPPDPPGYNPETWPTGVQQSSGRTFVQNADTGNYYFEHPEDERHWRHWDIEDANQNDLGSCPSNRIRPWPNQKRSPYGNQSATDPSGDAPEWQPPSETPWWLRIPSSLIDIFIKTPIIMIGPYYNPLANPGTA